jgi:hypothetical protein
MILSFRLTKAASCRMNEESESGADSLNRTGGLRVTRAALCQLSYVSEHGSALPETSAVDRLYRTRDAFIQRTHHPGIHARRDSARAFNARMRAAVVVVGS